ncbi:hypothetical protein T440DRAFT_461400 [Plenodomus tracheiphilus IPT5]|uniref:Uncharacterized protein n=1 Tax=Plenodomus tracheiphilus IPT5 TaxID=1408161 RepID=A0A6A7AQ78_9PLEO|nr:hypothetical protein T440DRAFT_461400 [Plenodomus tracheiphilus IPT5]
MLSLPLAKLSVALDTDPDAHSFTWQHQTHDLSFVIDSYGGHGSPQLCLKIVQGSQVRQAIEIQRLISEGHDMARAMQDRGVSLKAEQLPVSAIVRCPLLAIRWQLPNQKVRRAQIKFTGSQDYDAAYSQLHQLGLRMTASHDARPYTPSSSSSPSRASSVRPSVTAATCPDRAPLGGLSCPPCHLAGIVSRPFTASNASMATYTQPQQVTRSRPFSALAGYSYANPTALATSSDPLTPPVYFPRPSSATTDLLQQSSSNTNRSPQGHSIMPTLADASRSNDECAAVSVLPGSPHSVEAPLPPRRELPFQRPSAPFSIGSDTARPPSRPPIGLMGPPPLPVRVTSSRPSSAREGALDTELPQLPQPTVVAKPVPQEPIAQKPPCTPNTNQHIPTDMGSILHQAMESPRPSSSSSNTRNSPKSSPSFLRRTNSVFSSPLEFNISSGNVIQDSQRASSRSNPTTPPTSDAMAHDQTVLPSYRPNDDGTFDDLRAYVMQPGEGRRAALNQFIFRHLENDDFLTLVEDMETCWARAALGMK